MILPASQRRLIDREQVCTYCGVSVPRRERSVDHDPPRAHVRNGHAPPVYTLWMACQSCNGLKGDRTAATFRRWLTTPDGEAWVRLRHQEAALGQPVPEARRLFHGAAGNGPARRALVHRKRRLRQLLRAAKLHGWTDDEVRRRWESE